MAFENEELLKALETLRKQLEIKMSIIPFQTNSLAERNQISALYEDHKQHYEALRQRLSLAERRLGEESQARKDLEYAHEQRLTDMKRAID